MYSKKDTSFICPMYYAFPENDNSYNFPHQYFFGSELLVAPYLHKADPDIRSSRAVRFLIFIISIIIMIKGRLVSSWKMDVIRFWTRISFLLFLLLFTLMVLTFEGNKMQVIYGKIDEIPIFAFSGSIIPLAIRKLPSQLPILNFNSSDSLNLSKNSESEKFEIRVFTGANREFTMYDDEGTNMDYERNGFYSITTLSQLHSQGIFLSFFLLVLYFTRHDLFTRRYSSHYEVQHIPNHKHWYSIKTKDLCIEVQRNTPPSFFSHFSN